MDDDLANNFAALYRQLLDEFRDKLPLYLSSDAVLDWFGNIVSGRENIAHYMLLEVPNTTHVLTSIKQSVTRVQQAVIPADRDASSLSLDLSTLSITSGNSPYVLATPMETAPGGNNSLAPVKCGRLFSTVCSDVLVMEAVGKLQFFHDKNTVCAQQKNMKVFKDVQRWERACRLHIYYSITDTGAMEQVVNHPEFTHFSIHKMVYRESAKCRRNLALEFEHAMKQT